MKQRFGILFIVILFLISCQDKWAPERAPSWATNANSDLIRPSEDEAFSISSPQYALAVVTGLSCGSSSEDAYQFDVSWVTTLKNADFDRIEYEIVGKSEGSDLTKIVNPEIYDEMDFSRAGSIVISISDEKIRRIGDRLLVHVVTGIAGGKEIQSPVDAFIIDKTCSDTNAQ